MINTKYNLLSLNCHSCDTTMIKNKKQKTKETWNEVFHIKELGDYTK